MDELPSMEMILAIRRRVRNLREMIGAAERDPVSQPAYLERLRKNLRAAESELYDFGSKTSLR